MPSPKLFIGSSKANLPVAEALKTSLKEVAHVTIWSEGVFSMGFSNLENLIKQLDDNDFAAFIMAPDDVITSNGQTKPGPRDNVLFESGLFMGVLGRDRVFLVYDETADIKIPSDLAGITLATYDGKLIKGKEASAAVRNAALGIAKSIKNSKFPHLVGDWKGEYPLTFEEGRPMATEIISIRTSGDCLYFATKENADNNFYTAWGRVSQERQIVGKWKSREGENDMGGIFMLTVSPSADYMYGYFTASDPGGGTVYATWILAKTVGADEAKIETRLASARTRLHQATVLGPTQVVVG